MKSSGSTGRPQVDDSHNCEQCGRYGAIQMGDRWLCPDCLQTGCSCCPEFEKDEVETDPPSGNSNC